VLCSSYSGTTEETLAAYDAAGETGAPRVVSASGGELAARARRDGVPVVPLPGGFQPRAAVGYSFVVALELAALAGAAPSVRAEVEAAAALARELAAEWGPDADEDGAAQALARRLDGSVPIVAGPGLAAVAAYRWKCQFNENAKLPSFAAELPEAGHNEIVGWAEASSFAPFAAVFLEDPGAGERAALRVALTADIVAGQATTVERVVPRGDTRVERLISLVLLGDLVSLYAAVLRGVDPLSIEPIDRLKAGLAAR
jgi:glucose/mannose-6-phosphate isomerase